MLLQLDIKLPYVLTKTRNESKRAETSQIDPLKIEKRPETIQNIKIGEICNFLLAFVFQTSSPNAQFWVFGTNKYQLSTLLMKFYMYPISNVQIWHWFSKILSPNSQIWHFGSKSINFPILMKFCLYRIPKMLISNLTYVFEKF